MENTIPTRIFGFLQNFPPFSLLPKSELMELSEQVIVRYLQPSEVVFKQGEQPSPYLHVVRDGAIHLYREENEEQILVDECDEGDLFGLRPLLAEEAYLLTAKAEEESLLYSIKVDLLKALTKNQPKIAWYLAQNFASGVSQRLESIDQGRIFHDSTAKGDAFKLVEVQSVNHSKKPVTCSPQTTVQSAAIIMRTKRVGSIIVTDTNLRPQGILTDRDLRNQVVTGDVPLDACVSEIMSQPVITIPPDRSVADVQIAMMQHSIHHLCITENGRVNSPVVGVISEHDLLVIQGNNPAIFIREISRSQSADDLRRIREKAETLLLKYLLQEVSINFISSVMTEVNDALITKAITMSLAEMEAEGHPQPDIDFCWLALGSEGREEQLLRTDQDNALVFRDVPEADYPSTKEYFLAFAKKVTVILNHCGFDFCSGDMMASNPNWCLSLSEWKAQFSQWILTPTEQNIMYCSIFFDFRPLFGQIEMSEILANHIFDQLEEGATFLALLAKSALENPVPLTFFRNFVVERGGEHKDEFDIKRRAMMPLADAARLLILAAKQPRINNTFRRFDHLATLEPRNKELFEQAADAYEILIRYRALQGLKNKDSGRYINPSDLTKMERLNLRNSFRPINDLQDLLKVRFRLNLIG
ncbi:MAG: DUF294 nucleotidyltransferase-like domain-containing protein [Bacteroidota bacterium]